ncbi:MAG TPA: hypothetical protein VK212_08440 [Lentimicrobium sp.]|nr:hypothetical protein [Lentimicrobium sp.]
MPLQAKHIVEEINGVRCTIVEKNTTPERCKFLTNLLSFNKFEVITDCKPDAEGIERCTIGVTDLVFNPVIAVYEMSLKTPSGASVSPAYWDQKETTVIDQYWVTRKEIEEGKSPWHL